VLGIGKYKRVFRLIPLQNPQQQTHFFIGPDMVELMGNSVDSYLLRLYLYLRRIVHVLPGKLTNAIVKRCTVQHGHAFFTRRHFFQDPAQIRQKTHVKQAVSLVNHQYINFMQIQFPLLIKIDQTARGSDKNIQAALQHFFLLCIIYPAVKTTCLYVQIAAK